MKKMVCLFASLAVSIILAFPASAGPPGGGGGNGGGGSGGGTEPAAADYHYTSLGTLGGDYSYPAGINNQGDVVGSSETAVINNRSKWRHAYLNMADGNGGRLMIDLHDLFVADGFIAALDDTPDHEFGWVVSAAVDINDIGQIAGHMVEYTDGQTSASLNFRYTPTGFNVNGDPVPVFEILNESTPSGSFVRAINKYGDVSGDTLGSGGLYQAIVWPRSGGSLLLGLWNGTETRGGDINDTLQVCGDVYSNGAWRYNLPGGSYQNLGTLFPRAKATSDWAISINNSGQVAGNSQDWSKPFSIKQRAFRYTDGTGLLDLGTLGGNLSRAESINDSGDVAGVSQTSSGQLHLFLYLSGTGMTDLDAALVDGPGYLLSGPDGAGPIYVNNSRQVTGYDPTSSEAYLLTPIP